MKKHWIVGAFGAGVLAISIVVYAATTQDIIWWGYGGTNYAKAWIDSSGRLSQQSMVSNGSSAFDVWPTSGTKPTANSIAEITLHRTLWTDSTMERLNISAMATADGAAYRFGVEKASGGSYRDMIFCFENTGGNDGGATCNFKITTAGVYVSHDQGSTWTAL